jgi:GNAT superfamily N-acetyltransferase
MRTPRREPAYTTKELTNKTLPDFERFFGTRPAPGAYTCWCLFNHLPYGSPAQRPGAAVNSRNRRRTRALVATRRTHGVLVYADGEPVGWCQYGKKEDLPRVDGSPRYRDAATGATTTSWRITCFVVQSRHRKRGVATLALKAVLEGIRRRGGGTVEGFPIVKWGASGHYRGTVSMFRREGFDIAAPFGPSSVVVRRRV